jgi:hypothetical protein
MDALQRSPEVIIDQARQLAYQHGEPFLLDEPINAPDVGLP